MKNKEKISEKVSYSGAIIKGATIVMIMFILTAGISYLFRLYLARSISIEEYGLFFSVFSFLNMVFGFKTYGVGSAFIKFVSENKAKNNNKEIKRLILYFTLIQFFVFGIISIIIFLTAKPLALYYFKNEKAYWPIIILTVAFFFSIFISTFRGFFQAYHRMDYYSSIEFFQIVFVLLFSFIFLSFGKGYLSPFIAYLFSFFLVAIVCFFLFLKLFPFFKIKAETNKKSIKKLIKFSLPISIGAVASSLVASEDIAILTYFRSLKEVALYNVALPTANLLRYIPRAFSVSILPISAHLYVNNKNQLSQTITQTYRYLFIMMMPLAMIFFAFSKEIINVLFGSQFVEASIALSLLSVSMIFTTIYLVNQNIIISINKPESYVKFLFLEAVISTILDLLLIPKFGIIGAASTAIIASFSLLLYSSIIIKNQIFNYIPYKSWIKTFILGFLTLGLIYIMKININMPFYFEAILISCSAMVFYLSMIFIFKLVTFDEIKNILSKILPKRMF